MGGFVVLFAVVCYVARQNHLQEEKVKAEQSRIEKSRAERAASSPDDEA